MEPESQASSVSVGDAGWGGLGADRQTVGARLGRKVKAELGEALEFVATYDVSPGSDRLVVCEGSLPNAEVGPAIVDEVGMAVAGGDQYQTSVYSAGELEIELRWFADLVVVRALVTPRCGFLIGAEPSVLHSVPALIEIVRFEECPPVHDTPNF